MTNEEQVEVIKLLLSKNSIEFNHTKAIEELNELATVLMQKINKMGGPGEPSNDSVTEEIGHVLIRITILTQMYGGEHVEESIDKKLTELKEMIDKGKHKNV